MHFFSKCSTDYVNWNFERGQQAKCVVDYALPKNLLQFSKSQQFPIFKDFMPFIPNF